MKKRRWSLAIPALYVAVARRQGVAVSTLVLGSATGGSKVNFEIAGNTTFAPITASSALITAGTNNALTV